MTTRTDALDEPGRIDGEAISETDEVFLAAEENSCPKGFRARQRLITLAREALASRAQLRDRDARIAELEAENKAICEANYDYATKQETLRAQVETLRSALEPFSYLVDTLKCSRDENSWVMKVEGREPITVADLRRARAALQSLSATEPER